MVACTDPDAVAYRRTLPESVAGPNVSGGTADGLATVNIYGPFENGFTNMVPGMSCLGSNTVAGGIDTATAELVVQQHTGVVKLHGIRVSSRTKGCSRHSFIRAFRLWLYSYSDPWSEGLPFLVAGQAYFQGMASGPLPMPKRSARCGSSSLCTRSQRLPTPSQTHFPQYASARLQAFPGVTPEILNDANSARASS